MRVKILAPAGFVIGYALVALPYEVVQRHFSPPTQDFPAWVIFELGAAILPFLVGTLAGYVLARAGTQDPPRSLSVAMSWFGGAAAVAAGTFFFLIQETAGLVLSLPAWAGAILSLAVGVLVGQLMLNAWLGRETGGQRWTALTPKP